MLRRFFIIWFFFTTCNIFSLSNDKTIYNTKNFNRVSIKINHFSDVPTAVNDAAEVVYESTDNEIDVLANDDFGIDGPIDGGLTMTNGTLNSASENGGLISIDNKNTADPSDDLFIYNAPLGFSGEDKFRYTITDSSGDASIGLVTVIVKAESNDPYFVNDYYKIDINSPGFEFDPTSNDNKGDYANGRMFVQLPNIYDQPFVDNAGVITLLDNGTPDDTSDDSLFFEPAQDYTGEYQFWYIYLVGNPGDTNFIQVGWANVKIDIKDLDDELSAGDDEATVDFESTENIISVLENDSYGPEGPTTAHEPLTLINGKQETATYNGALIRVSDNDTANDKTDDVVLYSAPTGFSGEDSFTYTLTDSSGNAVTATVRVTVGPKSPPSGAVDDQVTLEENSLDNVIDVMANDVETIYGSHGDINVKELQPLDTNSTTEAGTISILNNGTSTTTDDKILYTPPSNFTGEDTFQYQIKVYSTTQGGSNAPDKFFTATVTVIVGDSGPPVNGTPTAVNDAAEVDYESSDNEIDVLDNDDFGSDGLIDGGLTMTNGTLNSASANGGLISVNNKNTSDTSDDVFIYNAPSGFSGVDTFNYTITDASGDASTGTVTVTVNPSSPLEGAVDDVVSVDENSTDNIIDVLANDNFATVGVGTMLINSPDHLTGTTTQGGLLTLDDGGTPGINQSDDRILYTPPANFTGVDTFDYTLTVGSNQYQGTVTVTVGNVDPPATTPTALNDVITVDFESTDNVISVLDNDSYGADGPTSAHEPLTLINGKQETATYKGALIRVSDNGTANDNTDDVVLYSAPTGFSGEDSFTYTLTDATGDAATATVTITVNAQETNTPTAVNDAVSVEENSTNNIIDVLENDIAGDDTPITLDSAALTASNGGTVSISNNQLVYTPATNFNGIETVDYIISDSNGDESTATVTISVGTVTPSATTPTAVNDAAEVDYESSDNEIDVLDNDDFGSDGPIDGGLTMTNGTLNSASTNGGLISVNNKNTSDTSDDVFIYNAPSGFSGVDTFNYTITDASGDASTGTVTVTVNPSSPLEGAVDDVVSVDENSTDNIIDVLANDNFATVGVGTMLINSPDHLTGTTTQGGLLTLDDGGTPGINQSDDRILYTPPANFTGVDTFDYTLTVGSNQYQGTVTVTVGNVDPPATTLMAEDDTASAPYYRTDMHYNPTEYANLAIRINVLSNDSYGPEGPTTAHAPLTLVNGKLSTASANGGEIRVLDNGTPTNYLDDVVFYRAPRGFNGDDTFTYTITDASGDAATAAVTVTVDSPPSSSRPSGNSFNLNDNTFKVYPNPSKGYLKTTLLSTNNTSAVITLFDLSGRVVYSKVKQISVGINKIDFNLDKKGVFILKIISKDIDFGSSKVIIE